MRVRVTRSGSSVSGTVYLNASKSESNRALIIRQCCPDVRIENLSKAEDTVTLERLLTDRPETMDVGAAGTTMRFLTAVLAVGQGTHVLTGSDRMKQRPIGILVDALTSLGADIEYMGDEGYPPLKIRGTGLQGGTIRMRGDVSSQFISSMLLIAPTMPDGLRIEFTSEVVSVPYLQMTIDMMRSCGAHVDVEGNSVIVGAVPYKATVLAIESDWSAASYWYEIAALSDEADIELVGLRQSSLQGDSTISKMFEAFGVTTGYTPNGIRISRSAGTELAMTGFEYDFMSIPDMAQTFACLSAGLGMEARMTGLQTLRVKETDRIAALHLELKKFGIPSRMTDDSLTIDAASITEPTDPIQTYHDHRMAMAFAPLALKVDGLTVLDPDVVNKSYPGYWNDLSSVGFVVTRE